MKKYTLILLVYISLSAKSQVVNRFRDSTWFAKSVRFDSAIYLIKGASNGKVLTSDAYGRATWQSASGGVSQSALDDSINSVRSIRKVDTLYKNLDSIIYKINGIRYAIKDSSGGLTDSTIFATKNYVNSLNGSNATITSLNDSITSVRNIRKVDTLYRNLDSIIYKINSIRYAIKDSTGGGADSQSLHLAFSDSIELSITRGNSIKFAYAIDSVSLITDSLIVFKGGVRKSYVKNTVSFAKNTAKDSIILTLNGNRYAVKDSIGSGGGASLSGLTAATGTNSINNADYSQEWKWNTLTSGGLNLTSTSSTLSANSSLFCAQLNTNQPTSGIFYYAGKFINRNVTGGSNVALYLNTPFGAPARALQVDTGDVYLTKNNSFVWANGATIAATTYMYLIAPTSGYMIFRSNSNNGFHFWNSSSTAFFTIYNASSTQHGTVFGGDYASGSFRSVGTSAATIEKNVGNLIFSANTGLSGGYASFTPNNIMTVSGANSNVGIGTTSPSSKAALDVVSTTKGFLPPRMTTTQRDAITSPDAGLIIYNTTSNKLNFYNGSAWEVVTSL